MTGYQNSRTDRVGYKSRGSYMPAATLDELRDEVRTVPCPYCPAKPGEKCLGVPRRNGTRRERESNHAERVYYYRFQHRFEIDARREEELASSSSPANVGEPKKGAGTMPVKKTTKKPVVTRGKTAPAKKTATKSPRTKRENTHAEPQVKRSPGRPRKFPLPPVLESVEPEFELLSEEEHSKLRIAGMSYAQLADLTGIQINTEGFLIALELLRGGRDRQEINDRVRELLPALTSTGTPKPVPNLVSSVMKKLEAKGFTVKGDWKMVKPAKGA